jgi:hypothetical protein
VASVERSPFPYQGPLLPEQVRGRDELLADLAQRLVDRRVTALLGPRRYGKTSLLRRVAADLEQVGPETVWVDLYELSSMADLAAALDRGLARATGRVRRALDAIAGSLSLRLGVLGVELTKGRRDRPDPVLAARSLLEVLVRTAERHDVLLVLDELAGVAGVEGAAALLRTGLQHHYQQLAIVFAGSQPSTMRALFTDRAQPFFAQADLLEVGPLAPDAVIDLVYEGFERTGRSPGAAVPRLVALAEGHPQRAMQLADALWRATGPRGTADDRTWEQALAEVRAGVELGAEALYSPHPAGHKRVLRVVASGGSVYGTAADVLGLTPGTARAALDALEGSGTLTRSPEGEVRVVDPLLADWLRRRFPL